MRPVPALTGAFTTKSAPGKIRTPDLLIRSQTLYPAELRAQTIKQCSRRDSNPHGVSPTGSLILRVYQFRHPSISWPMRGPNGSCRTGWKPGGAFLCRLRVEAMLEEGLEPSRGCPHRNLNPARLPIPPPEPGTSNFSDEVLGPMEPRGIEPLTS